MRITKPSAGISAAKTTSSAKATVAPTETSSDKKAAQPTATSTEQSAKPSSSSFATRLRKRIFCAIAFVLVVCALNTLCMRIFIPYASWSFISWDAYHEAPQVTELITGSSFAERDIQSPMLASELGEETYNIAVPYQSIEDSFSAIQQAKETRNIRSVILGVRYESFTKDPAQGIKTHSIFSTAAYKLQHPKAFLDDFFNTVLNPKTIKTPDSINYAFPWIYHMSNTDKGIVQNIYDWLSGKSRVASCFEQFPNWHYLGYGYGNYTGHQDFTENDQGGTHSLPLGDLDPTIVEHFRKICAYCKDNNIRLNVVSVPHQSFDIVSFGDRYPELMRPLQAIAEDSGARWIDFNFMRDNEYRNTPDDFVDSEHLNLRGAQKLTRVLADILKSDDPDKQQRTLMYSYDEWGQVAASYRGVRLVRVSKYVENGVVQGKITGYYVAGTPARYQILAKKIDPSNMGRHAHFAAQAAFDTDNNYRVVRDWSSDTDFSISGLEPGSYSFIVRATPTMPSLPDQTYCRFVANV